MNSILRNAIALSVLGVCSATLSVHAQTAVPGPGSTNATVDAQNLDEKSTREKDLPQSASSEAKKQTPEGGAVGSETPTYGDGSSGTELGSVTQPIQGSPETRFDTVGDCSAFSDVKKEACDQAKQENHNQMEKVRKKNQMSGSTK